MGGFEKELVTFGLTMLGGFICWLFQARVKLQWGIQDGLAFELDGSDGSILCFTKSLTVMNSGRKPAEDVQITFGFPPTRLKLWPSLAYEVRTNPEGHRTVIIPVLAPNEQVRLTIVNLGQEPPMVLSVRSKQMTADEIRLYSAKQYPSWALICFATIFLVGAFSIIHWLVKVISVAF